MTASEDDSKFFEKNNTYLEKYYAEFIMSYSGFAFELKDVVLNGIDEDYRNYSNENIEERIQRLTKVFEMYDKKLGETLERVGKGEAIGDQHKGEIITNHLLYKSTLLASITKYKMNYRNYKDNGPDKDAYDIFLRDLFVKVADQNFIKWITRAGETK